MNLNGLWLQQVDEPPLEGPVGTQIVLGSDWVSVEVWELDRSYRPKYVTGDADNYVKAVSDALNGAAYLDDKQIHHMEVFFSKEGLE